MNDVVETKKKRIVKHSRLVGIVGPMFASKSNRLYMEIDKHTYTHTPFRLFQPIVDDRRYTEKEIEIIKKEIVKKGYANGEMRTNNGLKTDSIVVPGLKGIIQNIEDHSLKDGETIYFEEIQFFSPEILGFIHFMLKNGYNISYCGLPATSENKPFPFGKPNPKGVHMGELLALHHSELMYLPAVCTNCGSENATYTFPLEDKKGDVSVGGEAQYTALCAKCYFKNIGDKYQFSDPMIEKDFIKFQNLFQPK